MPFVKKIVCLANSRKHSQKSNGRCIAGIEIVDGKPGDWVRPVSSRPGAEVSEYERRYEDGSDPQVLDVVNVPLLESAPDGYQVENWTLDPERYWARTRRVTWAHLQQLEDRPGALWPSADPATYFGMHDRVLATTAEEFDYSLRLIRV
jgi:hypothetical protein